MTDKKLLLDIGSKQKLSSLIKVMKNCRQILLLSSNKNKDLLIQQKSLSKDPKLLQVTLVKLLSPLSISNQIREKILPIQMLHLIPLLLSLPKELVETLPKRFRIIKKVPEQNLKLSNHLNEEQVFHQMFQNKERVD